MRQACGSISWRRIPTCEQRGNEEADLKKVSSHIVLGIPCFVIAMLLMPTPSEARIVSVQMSAPTIAFGGYSWPGVGQYERITGVAYAEVDPADPRNAVIVDIGLAQPQAGVRCSPARPRRARSAYLLEFLHPEAGQSGRGRSEPQRLRQGDVRAAQPRRQDVDRAWAASAAAATTPRPSRIPPCSRTRS